ncbi:MAG: enoyl-CoA hydratase-related protein, partial [Flavobacteriales bacterium]|nr:enoyl-CoA hydratase-related protein [Flavobacteriales bacterium]
MESILVHFANGVKHIKLNRPQVFNSFNKEMALRFQEELEEAKDNDEVRCVLISGEGKAFCAGQDLAEIMDPEGPELKSIVRDHYNPIVRQITALPKPVVAAVNGVAAGAGANIALACDVVLARKSASFIQAFSKIGLI